MRFLSESYLWILHCCIAAYIQIWLNRFGVSPLNDNLLWFFKLDSYVSWIRDAISQWFIKFGFYTFYGHKTLFHVVVICFFIHFTHLLNMCYIFYALDKYETLSRSDFFCFNFQTLFLAPLKQYFLKHRNTKCSKQQIREHKYTKYYRHGKTGY